MKKALTHYQCRPLVEENKELKKRIAELEQFKSEHTPLLSFLAVESACNISNFKNWLAIRDLEQKANAIESVRKHNVRMKRKFGSQWGAGHVIENLQIEERNLREQIKLPKEQR